MTTGPNHAPDTTQPTGPGDTPTATQIDQMIRDVQPKVLRVAGGFILAGLVILGVATPSVIRTWPHPGLSWPMLPLGGACATLGSPVVPRLIRRQHPWTGLGGTVLSPRRDWYKDLLLFWLYLAALAWIPLGLHPGPDDSVVRIWAAPVILLPMVVAATKKFRSTRSSLVLTPAGIHMTGRDINKTYDWDTVVVTPRPVINAKNNIGQSVFLASANEPLDAYMCGGIAYTLWQFMVIVEHFRDHPADRPLLATPDAIALLDKLADYPTAPDAPRRPRWLKPPPADWTNRTWPAVDTSGADHPRGD